MTTVTLPARESAAAIPDDPRRRNRLVEGGLDFHGVTDTVCGPVEGKTPLGWWIGFGISACALGLLLAMIAYLVWRGLGVWGINSPVGWGFAIVNFVWWVGIGHAGTLISAILYLFRQKWRTGINRFAEGMTIFAVICALLFPTIHVGRIWVIWFVLPIPTWELVWPQFRSPLLWDVFAVGTYFTVSLIFWFMGLIPDLATLRDRAAAAGRKIRWLVYGILALGWRGSTRHWTNYEKAYLILAGLSTPLVLSVHSIVSFDFAVSIVPGWHTTIFPPYFVAGAIFSGFAMVMTLAVIARKAYRLQNLITLEHLDNMNKIMLVTGMMVGYAYATEFFISWYSGNGYEEFAFVNRAFGPYGWAYWIMVSCNVLVPQIFWVRRLRRSIPVMFAASILINVGMWFERFVIVMTLHRDYIPSAWGYYKPTWVDICTLIGSLGLFFTLFFLFIRFLPVVAMAEVKNVMPASNPHARPEPEPVGATAS
jgi:molybdopterin-containing oxidoreductase family membrane subunit